MHESGFGEREGKVSRDYVVPGDTACVDAADCDRAADDGRSEVDAGAVLDIHGSAEETTAVDEHAVGGVPAMQTML